MYEDVIGACHYCCSAEGVGGLDSCNIIKQVAHKHDC